MPYSGPNFRAFIFWSVKCFAQLCRIDPIDFLNSQAVIFPMVYSMSLCKFFPGRLKILQDYSLEFYTACFYCMPSWGLSKYIQTKLQTTCSYLIYSFFKNKERSGISLPASFTVWFLNNFFLAIFYYSILLCYITWSNFIVWLPLLRKILGSMCIVIVC